MVETTPSSNRLAVLSLSKSDRIRFTHFPPDVYQKIEGVLRQSWPPGIKAESDYAGSYEYQMKGRPWGMMGKVEAIGSRRLLRDILQYLHRSGWVLKTVINISEKIRSKDNMVFKLADTPPPPVEWFVVQFFSSSKIYLHGAESALTKDLKKELVQLEYFDKGEESHDAFEFSLKGTPWYCHGHKSMKVRVLLLQIAEVLDKHGWETYGSIRQRTESDDRKVCDSWYLTRRIGAAGEVTKNDASAEE